MIRFAMKSGLEDEVCGSRENTLRRGAAKSPVSFLDDGLLTGAIAMETNYPIFATDNPCMGNIFTPIALTR